MKTKTSVTRREFLAAAAAVPFAAPAFAQSGRVPVGIELYSVRGELGKDLPGTVRALAHMGILKDTKKFKVGKAPEKVRWVELLGQSYYVYAPDHGLFEPAVKLGATVKKGDLCGLTHFVDNPGREPVPAYFKDSGIVICQRHYGRVERGDCVSHLATDRAAP